MIIFEGPDGAGKTYAANWLSSQLQIPIYKFSGPPTSKQDLIDRMKTMFRNPNRIFDRCSAISEPIYGPIIRGKSLFTNREVNDYIWIIKRLARVIYCRPSFNTISSSSLRIKPHKLLFHVNLVEKNLEKIIEEYDSFMFKAVCSGLSICMFNRDTMPMEDLLCAVST